MVEQIIQLVLYRNENLVAFEIASGFSTYCIDILSPDEIWTQTEAEDFRLHDRLTPESIRGP
jgi:hypothetical protein